MPSTQQVVLITGCSEPQSIGAAMVRDFLCRGFTVYATARKVETMKDLAVDGAKLLALDVVDEASIRAAVDHVSAEEGRLDVLINNAGVIDMAPSLEFDVQAVQRMMDVNFFGVLRVYQAFAPLMLRTANHPDVVNKMNKERAVIVNIGSTAGVGGPWQGAYGASKVRLPCSIPSAHLGWPVHALTEAMSYELANMGIHTICVKLGATRSAMTANAKPFQTRRSNPSESGPSLPYWDDIYNKCEATFTEQVYAKAEKPENVARSIGDAVMARAPPQDLWVGMGAPIFRYFWGVLPIALRRKMWSMMTGIDMVRRPKVEELMVLPGEGK